MKKLFILTLLLLLCGCQNQPSVSNERIKSLGDGLKETKYNTGDFKRVIKDNYKDKIEAEFKNKKLKISRWDDEVNLELELRDDKKKAKEVKIYDITEGEGGMEFEVDLLEKPLTNKIEFNLNNKGLDFFYQPPLNEEMKNDECWTSACTETDCCNSHRPENVVGSYAVYAKEKKINLVGGKEYKTGQMGMFYRPRICDSNNQCVWGILNISGNTLSVEIPQDFLNEAAYPIKHAAGLNFGYETAGGSYATLAADNMRGSIFAGAAGTVTGMSAYYAVYGDGKHQKTYLVLDSDKNLLTNGVSNAYTLVTGGGGAWHTSFVFGTNPTITAVNYWLGIIGDYNLDIYYNSLAINTGFSDTSNSYTTPANPTDGSFTTTATYSIYATYTASGGGSTTVQPDDNFTITDN